MLISSSVNLIFHALVALILDISVAGINDKDSLYSAI